MSVRTYNQGQDCAAPNTILVHDKIYDELLEKLRLSIKKLKIGPYNSPETDIGPISRPETLPTIKAFLVGNAKYIDKTTNGVSRARNHIIEPTIVNKSLKEGPNFTELFAPVFVLQRYENDDDLSIYFEDEQYRNNAMYITIYGKSTYLKAVCRKPKIW